MKDLLELGQPLGKDEFTPTTLQAVLRDAARQAESSADTHDRLILELPSDPMTVRGVFGKLKLAFLHLFDNAFQNSPLEGRVYVRVQEDGPSWVVQISDEGTGLAPEIRDRLFDPFVTTHEGHRGLGLTMVRHCLSAHHGTVTASDNAPQPGATFTVVLPKGTAVPQGR
jgi:signal transduction histidine kinase